MIAIRENGWGKLWESNLGPDGKGIKIGSLWL